MNKTLKQFLIGGSILFVLATIGLTPKQLLWRFMSDEAKAEYSCQQVARDLKRTNLTEQQRQNMMAYDAEHCPKPTDPTTLTCEEIRSDLAFATYNPRTRTNRGWLDGERAALYASHVQRCGEIR